MVEKILVNFMSANAAQCVMKHLTLRQGDWTLKLIYEGLFNYCFPPDFKLQLRDQLIGAHQGKNDVRDFHRDIETLAMRFPDVIEQQLAHIFWNGVNQYLRMHLIKKGLSPEKHAVSKLLKYVSRHKAAKCAWRNETESSQRYRDSMSRWSSRNTYGQCSESEDNSCANSVQGAEELSDNAKEESSDEESPQEPSDTRTWYDEMRRAVS
jgi:hypothetical protein